MHKLAIVTTHPIQYYAPWFKYLSTQLDLIVYYLHDEKLEQRLEGDFGIAHNWDVNLLEGYKSIFLTNISKKPNVNTFNGCDTPEIYKVIKENKFDAVLVLGWNIKSFWQTIFACKLNKIPIMVRGDSNLTNDKSKIKRYIKKAIYPIFLNFFDLILTVGKKNREYLNYYNISNKKIVFVPHFIDQNFFNSKIINKDIRNELEIDKDSFLLLFVGKFIEIKNPILLLKAIKNLLEDSVKIEAVFVGSGLLEKELKNYNFKYLNNKVHFVGFKNQSELSDYYKQSDLLIVPSLSETWGLVVNEAFSLLTPAIVSNNVGCHDDLITLETTGSIFENDNEIDLSNKISSFILNMNKEKTIQAIKEKNKIYSIEYASKKLITAIDKLKKKDLK